MNCVRKQWIRAGSAVLFACVFLVFSACDSGDASADAEAVDRADEPGDAVAAAPEDEAPEGPEAADAPADLPGDEELLDDGLVTYTAGDVEDRVADESWRFTDIGLAFGFDHAFRTGDSGSAELQFGDSAIIHLSEATDLRVEQLAGTDDAEETVLDLSGGTVRGRLDSIRGDEALQVRTEGAVVGVRGTAFEVSYDEETRSSSVGVSSGEVVVRPRAAEEARIRVATIADPEAGSLLEEIVGEIEASYTVRADEELLFSVDDFAEINEEIEALLEFVPRVDDESLDEAERDQARGEIRSRSDEVRDRLPEFTLEILELDESRRNRLIDIEEAVNVRAAGTAGMFGGESEAPDDPTDEMAPSTADADGAPAARAAVSMTELLVSPEPADAAVALTGRPRSRGAARALYLPGTEVRVRVSRDGYTPREEQVLVADDGRQEISMVLTPEQEASPDEAAALKQATAAEEAAAPEDASPPAPDEDPAEDPAEERNINLEFDIQPREAVVSVDGAPVSGSSYIVTVEEERTVTVEASAEGWESERREVEIGDSPQEEIAIALEPAPLSGEVSLFDSAVVRAVATAAGTAYVADFSGTVAAVSTEAEELWQTETENEFNENAVPVFTDGASELHFSGTAEWYAFDPDNGRILHDRELDAESVHPFGRRVISWGDRVVYPENSVLRVYDAGFEEVASIDMEREASMTPLVSGDRAWIVSQNGTLYEVDLRAESVREVVATGATQPLGHAPVWLPGAGEQQLVFGDREGSVFAVDIADGEVLWERTLADGSAVLDDPVAAGNTIFVSAGESIFALSPDGSERFDPVEDAAAGAMVHGQQLVYPSTGGEIVGVDVSTGAEQFRFPVGQALSTSVSLLGGDRYVVGTETGSLLFVHAEAVREW